MNQDRRKDRSITVKIHQVKLATTPVRAGNLAFDLTVHQYHCSVWAEKKVLKT
jgi:methylthioribose-1-phosphate isomerase